MALKSDDWFDDNFNVEKLLKQAKEVSELNKQIDKEKLKEFYKKQKLSTLHFCKVLFLCPKSVIGS